MSNRTVESDVFQDYELTSKVQQLLLAGCEIIAVTPYSLEKVQGYSGKSWQVQSHNVLYWTEKS